MSPHRMYGNMHVRNCPYILGIEHVPRLHVWEHACQKLSLYLEDRTCPQIACRGTFMSKFVPISWRLAYQKCPYLLGIEHVHVSQIWAHAKLSISLFLKVHSMCYCMVYSPISETWVYVDPGFNPGCGAPG